LRDFLSPAGESEKRKKKEAAEYQAKGKEGEGAQGRLLRPEGRATLSLHGMVKIERF
jgi:hypothetical protein